MILVLDLSCACGRGWAHARVHVRVVFSCPFRWPPLFGLGRLIKQPRCSRRKWWA